VANEINETKKKDAKSGAVSRWFSELKSELKKVTWPSKKQIISNTNIVFLMILVFGILVWIFDGCLMGILNFILDRTPD
jgi:preprotein translocase subunit SecE